MNDVKFTGLFKPLDLINTIRFEYIKSMCSLKGKKILDLGCGMGLLANKLALHGARVLGVDQSKSLIDLAQKRSMPNIQYVNMNLLDIGDINDRFDIVICMEVLEHLKDLRVFFNLLNTFRTGHTVFFISSLKKELLSYINYIFFAEYFFIYLKKNTHIYDNFLNILSVYDEFLKMTFTLNDINFIKYHYLFDYTELKIDGGLNYMLFFSEMK